MSKAETVAGRIRASEEPPETGYIQPGQVEVQHAEALRQLGDLIPAQSYAQEALRTADGSHLRSQFHRYATFAMSLAAGVDAEAAVAAGGEMLSRAQGMESHRVRDRVKAVCGAVQAQGDSIVAREFANRVRAQLSVPA